MRLDCDNTRGTHDLDLIPIPIGLSPEKRTQMILEMKKIGLSPEQLNSAADFFIGRVKDWEKNILIVRQFSGGKIYRPNLTLFSFLKFSRGTPIDLDDIRAAERKWGRKEFDKTQFSQWANSEILAAAKNFGIFE